MNRRIDVSTDVLTRERDGKVKSLEQEQTKSLIGDEDALFWDVTPYSLVDKYRCSGYNCVYPLVRRMFRNNLQHTSSRQKSVRERLNKLFNMFLLCSSLLLYL
jgi:hypothetical protein